MASPTYGLADFVREMEEQYAVDKPESFWSCEPAFQRLLASGAVRTWVNGQLKALCENPQYVGDWSAGEATLHRGQGWTISIAVLDTPRRFIHALPFFAFYAPMGHELVADKYRLPETFRNDVFDPSQRLERVGTEVAKAGEVLRLETARHAYDLHIPRPIPALRLTSATLRPMEWLFSKSTLQAWQANDADLSSTQLRVAAYVLGKIAHHSSVDPLRQLASHPHHAVRWAAIQNLGRLSRSEALVKIKEAVNDAHPHVRRAAQKTLDQLDKRTQR